MKRTTRHASVAVALGMVGTFVAVPALAVNGYSTAHLNLRTGPGTQYPVVGVMEWNVRSHINGCLADWSWCSVSLAGLTGWVSAEYLVVDEGGQALEVDRYGPQTRIPIVAAEGFTEVVAGPTVGVVVGVGGHVAAIVPERAVLEYIAATPVNPIFVQGEVVVGARLPTAVQLYEVPGSAYGYTVINGLKVLVEPNARTIVYIHR